MTSGEFITNTNLTFLGNINFSHLQNTGRKFVSYCYGKLSAFEFCIKKFIFAYVVHYKFLNELIGMCIIRPSI